MLNITIMISLALASTIIAQQAQWKNAPATSQSRADKKLEREVLSAENQFKQAIVKRDVTLLERILADYYADSYEGSDRAVSKKLAVTRYQNGVLPYYSIDENRKISVRADIVVIEGISHTHKSVTNDVTTDVASGRQTYVKRLWTKKQGSWQLIAQTLEPLEKGSNREEQE
jgi:hypothetical protein